MDTRVGLGILAVGFALQAAGFVLTLAGVRVTTSAVRTMLALALAAFVALLSWLIARRVTRWMRTKWAQAVISAMAYSPP